MQRKMTRKLENKLFEYVVETTTEVWGLGRLKRRRKNNNIKATQNKKKLQQSYSKLVYTITFQLC